jgi:serine/threonine protein kinase
VLFWSPELVLQKIVNHKVDIWALGIVILEVLNSGKAPYEDEKLEEDEVLLLLITIIGYFSDLFIYLFILLLD